MAMWVEYLILAAPSAFPWFYLVRLYPLSSYDQLETIIKIIKIIIYSNDIIFIQRFFLR